MSKDSLFPEAKLLQARAVFVGQRLNLKAFEKTARLALTPLTVRAGAQGCAVLFRYGAVVFFGLDAAEEAAFLREVTDFITTPFTDPATEDAELQLVTKKEAGVTPDHIKLPDFDVPHLQLVADVLAKSAVLNYYESAISGTFDQMEPLALDLQTRGVRDKNARTLLRHIGQTMFVQSKMVGRVEIEEKPELLWDHPELARLFALLEDEYELRERHQALNGKLDLIHKTAETLFGLLQDKRTLHVEWYITILIVIEIFISLWEMAH